MLVPLFFVGELNLNFAYTYDMARAFTSWMPSGYVGTELFSDVHGFST